MPLFPKLPAPVIFGCSGLTLTSEERDFFQDTQPLGFILFKRNVQDKAQLKALVETLKSTLQHPNPPILIDQEGGRVARLTAPHWFHPPASAQLVTEDLQEAKKRVYEAYQRMAQDLTEVGILDRIKKLRSRIYRLASAPAWTAYYDQPISIKSF